MTVVQAYDLKFGPSSEAEGGDTVPFTRIFGEEDFDSGFRWLDLCIVKPGAEISGHSHFEDDELYYIIRGSATKVVNDAEARVGPGDAILLRSGGSHALHNDSDSDEVHVLVIDLLASPVDDQRLLARNIHKVPFATKRSKGGSGEIQVGDIYTAEELGSAWDFVQSVKLPAGSAIGVHAHEGDEEIYYIVDGEGVMIEDGEEYDVGPGTASLCKSGSSHGLANISAHELTLLVAQAPVT